MVDKLLRPFSDAGKRVIRLDIHSPLEDDWVGMKVYLNISTSLSQKEEHINMAVMGSLPLDVHTVFLSSVQGCYNA